jgi:hypothetical protein
MSNVDRYAVRLDAQGMPIDKPISDAVLQMFMKEFENNNDESMDFSDENVKA